MYAQYAHARVDLLFHLGCGGPGKGKLSDLVGPNLENMNKNEEEISINERAYQISRVRVCYLIVAAHPSLPAHIRIFHSCCDATSAR